MKQIIHEQRYQIEAYLKAGMSKGFIAVQLSIDRSSIFREVKRNSKKTGAYSASFAQMLCDERKERLKRKRSFDQAKENLIKGFIEKEQWSPEQIVGYCKKNGVDMVSHERIYQYIRQDKKLGGGLYKHLRHRIAVFSHVIISAMTDGSHLCCIQGGVVYEKMSAWFQSFEHFYESFCSLFCSFTCSSKIDRKSYVFLKLSFSIM